EGGEEGRVESILAALRRDMWRYAGLLREATTLREGLRAQVESEGTLAEIGAGRISRRLVEAQSLSAVAGAILLSALARTESRGAHFRNDFPMRDDAHFRKHSILRPEGTAEPRIAFEAW
ncbi:MAG TPA: hypothetical protein VL967_06020, partial [Terracidiphilus sp.]|nr:hypothetical protein [Terracidiphilus sp.]